jgi:hypothetical protein
MAKVKTSQIQRITNRPNEGARVAITNFARNEKGESTVEFNLLAAPVPDRRYAADVGTVLKGSSGCRVIFGQSSLGPSDSKKHALRSVIDIQISMRGVREFLKSLESVKDALAMTGIKAFDLLSEIEEPEHAAGLTANLIPIAFANEECCMDFYQLSPFVRSALGKGGDLAVEPVVRVNLPTGLFVGIVERLAAYVEPEAQKPNKGGG